MYEIKHKYDNVKVQCHPLYTSKKMIIQGKREKKKQALENVLPIYDGGH